MAPRLGRGEVVYRGVHLTMAFDPDKEGIRRIAVGADLRDACMDVVEHRAKPFAISISPRSDHDDENDPHEHYQDSFRTQTVLTGLAPESIGDPPMLRVGARLVNVARHAAAVEWGNRIHPTPHRILGKTIAHLNSGA